MWTGYISIYPPPNVKKKMRWDSWSKKRMGIENLSYAEAAAGYHAHYPIKCCLKPRPHPQRATCFGILKEKKNLERC